MTEQKKKVEIRGWQKVIDALPPLSEDDRQGLAAGIAEDGVLVPVYVLPDGRIIDGHHRWELSGGTAETRTIDVPEDEAFRLAISLNVNRRHMTPETTREKRERMKETVRTLREGGMKQKEAAKIVGVAQQRVADWEGELQKPTNTGSGISTPPPDFRQKIPFDAYDAIVDRLSQGESRKAIAKDYGASDEGISKYVKREAIRRERAEAGFSPGKSGRRRKLTDAQEHEIELTYRAGMAPSTLASTYGASESTIYHVIQRVRAYRDANGIAPPPIPPDLIITGPPSNVVNIHGRRPPREVFPKRDMKLETVRNQAVQWWTRYGKKALVEFRDLQSRCGDALTPALRVGAEGEIVVEGLETAAAAYGAAAESIRCGNTGQEDRGHGSTGS